MTTNANQLTNALVKIEPEYGPIEHIGITPDLVFIRLKRDCEKSATFARYCMKLFPKYKYLSPTFLIAQKQVLLLRKDDDKLIPDWDVTTQHFLPLREQ